MNKKHIKVAYTNRLSGGSYTQVPKIQMEGRWLGGRIWGRFPVYPPNDRNGTG